MSIYDDPDLQSDAEYVSFDAVGDGVEGVVFNIGKHAWDDGKVSIKLNIRTENGDKTLTAGQVKLKALIQEQRPEIGDTVKIKMTQVEKRTGGKTLKHFAMTTTKGDGTVPAGPDSAEEPF